MLGIFADISPDLPIEGEERFEDGTLIKMLAGLRQIELGDVIQVNWMIEADGAEVPHLGNWIRGVVSSYEKFVVTPKGRSMARVLQGNLQFYPGWRLGRVTPEVSSTPNKSGLYTLGSRTTTQMGNVYWDWSLRTDDLPGWEAFLVGHDCSKHGAECTRPGYKAIFNEARVARRNSL